MSKIRIFTTKACPYCKMEKEYLASKNISFEEVAVDENPKAAQEMIDKSGQMGVPVTEIVGDNGKEKYILGFDKAKLDEELGTK